MRLTNIVIFYINFAEMKRYCLILACCIAALATLSCKKKAAAGDPPIALVSSIISDPSLPAHKLVADYNANDASKSIFVAGSPVLCESLRQKLMTVDEFDNIDGKRMQDGLPDFAGEVICTMVDFANSPYGPFVEDARLDDLREVSVRNVLAAMDTLCYINEFDRRGVASKPLPKLLVLASPYADAFGKYDIDTLFSSLGCSLPVMYPFEVMLDKVFKSKKGPVMVGVLSGKESLSPAGYEALVARKAAEEGRNGCGCIVFPSDSGVQDPLLAFLDSCLVAGRVRPLDAIIVDDPAADASNMRWTLRRITDSGNQESLSYGNLVSAGCMLQEITGTVSEECYRILRGNNLFTHNIAYPKSLEFKTVLQSDSTFVLTPYDNGDPLR